MKIRVTKNAWYNLEYLKGSEGKIIDYKGDKVPSWGEKIKGDKKPETKTPEANKVPEANKTPEGNEKNENSFNNAAEVKKAETQNQNTQTKEAENNQTQGLNDAEKKQYLELLINEAIEKNILIEDADKKTVDEQILELENKLGKERR